MAASTRRTIPLSIGQREIVVVVATKTEARGRRTPSDDAHRLAGPLSLIFQLATTVRPAGRRHPSGSGVIPRPSGHVQILEADGIQPTHEVRTPFVPEILSPVRPLLMPSRYCAANLRSILRPCSRLGESPLEDLQAIPFGFHPLGRPPLFPGRKPPEVVESEIAPYGTVPCVSYGVRDWVSSSTSTETKNWPEGTRLTVTGFTWPGQCRLNPVRIPPA